MAQDDDIIDVTPESVSEEPAAQTKPKRSGLTSLVLLLLVVLVAFGGGIYLSPDLRERLGLPSGAATIDLSPLEAQIANLEAKVEALETQPAPSAGASEEALTGLQEQIDSLGATIDTLQNTILESPSGSVEAGALKQLQDEVASLGEGFESVQAAIKELQAQPASTPQITANDPRIDDLAEQFAALDQKIENRPATVYTGHASDLQAGLMSLAVAQLRQAVSEGRPFAEEREAVEQIVAQQEQVSFLAVDALRTLKDYEAVGVTSLATLRTIFDEAARRAQEAHVEGQSWWEQALSWFTDGIVVTNLDEAPDVDQDPMAAIGHYIDSNQLEEAQVVFRTLPDETQADFADWHTDMLARIEVNNALADLDQTAREMTEAGL